MRRFDANRWLIGLAALLAGSGICAAAASTAPSTGRTGRDLPACAPLSYLAGPVDYRTGNSTELLRAAVVTVNSNHYFPAIERMRHGEYSQRVMADLDFTLRHWPNHLPALEALIRYDLAGGKVYEFEPAFCYFERARAWVPDDPGVLLHEGYYFWKKKDIARAIEAYEAALTVDPKSADAHYSLGLMYCETRQYDKALVHAHAAYDAGYPLPGLKHKLQQAGNWADEKPQ